MRYLLFLFFSTFVFSQQTKSVDFKSVIGKISISKSTKSISGTVKYNFRVNSIIDTIRIDAMNMTFTEVKINNKLVNFKFTNKQLLLFEGFKMGTNKLTFQYEAQPKQTLYFVGDQIWTQGQGKYTSHWFPSFDDTNEKVIFELDITFDKNYQVISNGILKQEIPSGENITWKYSMSKPMSSYLLMIAIGNFENQVLRTKSGIPLQLFIEPEDKLKFEPTYRHSKITFDFLEKQIGIKYPWKIYKQIPVRDFLYAGMENTSATIFSRDFVVDSIGYNDRNYVNVNAHELAHQWFGDLVTAKSEQHHWLQEGFATYYALLAEKEVFGEDYFYNKLYETAKQLKEISKTDTIPILNKKASSFTYYQKGALALFALENEIGNKNLQKAIKKYLKKHEFKNVETNDFLNEISKVSHFDVAKFQKEWLESSKYETSKTFKYLKNWKLFETLETINSFDYFEKKEYFLKLIQSDTSIIIKIAILEKIKNIEIEDKKEIIKYVLALNDFNLNKNICNNSCKIPEDMQPDFEKLLDNPSYFIKQQYLPILISNFPENLDFYLEKTKNVKGFNDKEFEILKDIYSISSPKYSIQANSILNKINNYTNPMFESSVRQNAFEALFYIKADDNKTLKNLVHATTHFKWHFVKFAKDKIRELIKDNIYRTKFKYILSELTIKEQEILNIILDQKY